MLALPRDAIHMWLICTDQVQDPALRERYRALLSADELLQEKKFRFAEDAQRYLLTRTLVRTVLSRYAAVAPEQWRFATNAFGKPALANTNDGHGKALAAQLVFNVSHTQGLVAMAVGVEVALGVDAEWLGRRLEPLELAQATFSTAELRAFAALAAPQQQARFFQHWTLKESYTKARGLGLSIPLQQVQFAFSPPAQLRLSLDAALQDDAKRWHLWQFRPSAEHVLALCAERRGDQPQQLSWWKTVPLVSEVPLQMPAVWASA